jgi:Uma2 family endonuclease
MSTGTSCPSCAKTVGGASRLPDVAYYRGGRPRLGTNRDALSAPIWRLKSCRPGMIATSCAKKCRWYVEEGSHAVLLLDPDAEIAEYFGPAGTWEAHVGTRVLPRADILPGLDLTPEAIFAILRQP